MRRKQGEKQKRREGTKETGNRGREGEKKRERRDVRKNWATQGDGNRGEGLYNLLQNSSVPEANSDEL